MLGNGGFTSEDKPLLNLINDNGNLSEIVFKLIDAYNPESSIDDYLDSVHGMFLNADVDISTKGFALFKKTLRDAVQLKSKLDLEGSAVNNSKISTKLNSLNQKINELTEEESKFDSTINTVEENDVIIAERIRLNSVEDIITCGCGASFSDKNLSSRFVEFYMRTNGSKMLDIRFQKCPSCGKYIVYPLEVLNELECLKLRKTEKISGEGLVGCIPLTELKELKSKFFTELEVEKKVKLIDYDFSLERADYEATLNRIVLDKSSSELSIYNFIKAPKEETTLEGQMRDLFKYKVDIIKSAKLNVLTYLLALHKSAKEKESKLLKYGFDHDAYVSLVKFQNLLSIDAKISREKLFSGDFEMVIDDNGVPIADFIKQVAFIILCKQFIRKPKMLSSVLGLSLTLKKNNLTPLDDIEEIIKSCSNESPAEVKLNDNIDDYISEIESAKQYHSFKESTNKDEILLNNRINLTFTSSQKEELTQIKLDIFRIERLKFFSKISSGETEYFRFLQNYSFRELENEVKDVLGIDITLNTLYDLEGLNKLTLENKKQELLTKFKAIIKNVNKVDVLIPNPNLGYTNLKMSNNGGSLLKDVELNSLFVLDKLKYYFNYLHTGDLPDNTSLDELEQAKDLEYFEYCYGEK